MATYDYQCPACDNSKLEVERPMAEGEPAEGYMCAKCGYRMVRVWTAAPVSFKGPGFYSTGNR